MRARQPRQTNGSIFTLAAALLLCAPLTGCLIAGYSTGGGWFLWPRGLGFLLMLLFILFMLLRRR